MKTKAYQYALEVKGDASWERLHFLFDDYDWAVNRLAFYARRYPSREYRLVKRLVGDWGLVNLEQTKGTTE